MQSYLLLLTILAFLIWLFTSPRHKKTVIYFDVLYLDTKKLLKGISSMFLTDLQKVSVSIAPVDAMGNPAKLDGVPSWTVSDETILTVTPAEDGMSAVVSTVGPLGMAQVAVVADADLGEGVTTIAGTLDIEVIASAATALSVSVGAPENR